MDPFRLLKNLGRVSIVPTFLQVWVGVPRKVCSLVCRIVQRGLKKKAVEKCALGSPYLSVNFALPLQENVRLGRQGKNVPNNRDGRWTRRKAGGSSLFDELANQQVSHERGSQTAHTEQSHGAGHWHHRCCCQRNHFSLSHTRLQLLLRGAEAHMYHLAHFLSPASKPKIGQKLSEL